MARKSYGRHWQAEAERLKRELDAALTELAAVRTGVDSDLIEYIRADATENGPHDITTPEGRQRIANLHLDWRHKATENGRSL